MAGLVKNNNNVDVGVACEADLERVAALMLNLAQRLPDIKMELAQRVEIGYKR
jgi:acylphosphatase